MGKFFVIDMKTFHKCRLWRTYALLNRFTLRISRQLAFRKIVVYGRKNRSPHGYVNLLMRSPSIASCIRVIQVCASRWDSRDDENLRILLELENAATIVLHGADMARMRCFGSGTGHQQTVILRGCRLTTESLVNMLASLKSIRNLAILRPLYLRGMGTPGAVVEYMLENDHSQVLVDFACFTATFPVASFATLTLPRNLRVLSVILSPRNFCDLWSLLEHVPMLETLKCHISR